MWEIAIAFVNNKNCLAFCTSRLGGGTQKPTTNIQRSLIRYFWFFVPKHVVFGSPPWTVIASRISYCVVEGNHALGPSSHLLLCCQVLRTRRVCDLWRTYLCLLRCCCCTSNYGIHLYQDFSNQHTSLKFWCNWDEHWSWILLVFCRFVNSCSRLKCFLCLLGGILVWVFWSLQEAVQKLMHSCFIFLSSDL